MRDNTTSTSANTTPCVFTPRTARFQVGKWVYLLPVTAEGRFSPTNWGRSASSSSKPIMPHCNAVVFSTRFQCFKTNADHTAMNMAKYGSTAALGLFAVTRSCQGKKQIQINRIQKKVTGNIKAKAITIACNAYPEHSAHDR